MELFDGLILMAMLGIALNAAGGGLGSFLKSAGRVAASAGRIGAAGLKGRGRSGGDEYTKDDEDDEYTRRLKELQKLLKAEADKLGKGVPLNAAHKDASMADAARQAHETPGGDLRMPPPQDRSLLSDAPSVDPAPASRPRIVPDDQLDGYSDSTDPRDSVANSVPPVVPDPKPTMIGSRKTKDILADYKVDPNASPEEQMKQAQARRAALIGAKDDPNSELGKNNDKGWKGRLWDITREAIIGAGETSRARGGQASGAELATGAAVGGLRGGFDPSIDERRAVERETGEIDKKITDISSRQDAENKRRKDIIAERKAILDNIKLEDLIKDDRLKKDPRWMIAINKDQISPEDAKYFNETYDLDLSPADWGTFQEEWVNGTRYIRRTKDPTYRPSNLPDSLPDKVVEIDGLHTTEKDAIAKRETRASRIATRRHKMDDAGVKSGNKFEKETLSHKKKLATLDANITTASYEETAAKKALQLIIEQYDTPEEAKFDPKYNKAYTDMIKAQGKLRKAKQVFDATKNNPPKKESPIGKTYSESEFKAKARAKGFKGRALAKATQQARRDGIIQ